MYLALLVLGEATADATAKEAELNRSTTYVQIKQLMSSGLVTTYKNKKKTLFAAESPSNLDLILDQRVRELQKKQADLNLLIPELTQIFAQNAERRPVVRFFEGKEGLLSMRKEMLREEISDIYVVTALDEFKKLFTQKELDDFSERRKQLGITTHILFSSETTDRIEIPAPNRARKINHPTPFRSDVYVFGHNVAFATHGSDVSGVLIINKNIADTMRNIFDMSWGANEPKEG